MPVTELVTKLVAAPRAKVCLRFDVFWLGSNKFLSTVVLTERKKRPTSAIKAWARTLQYKVAKCMGISRGDALSVRLHLKSCNTSITLPLRQHKDATDAYEQQLAALKNAWSLLLVPQASAGSSEAQRNYCTVPVTVSRYSPRQVALSRILTSSTKTCVYATMPLELRRDRCIAMLAITKHADSLAHVPDGFNESDKLLLVREAVRHFPLALKQAGQHFQSDRSVVEVAVNANPEALQYAAYSLQNNNFDLVFKAVQRNCDVFRHATPRLRDNPHLANMAVEKKSALIINTRQLFFDKALTLKAVRQNGMCLSIVAKQFKKDFDVVDAAVKECAYALKYASLNLRLSNSREH